MPVQVIAIGTSAGGQQALTSLLSYLPSNFPAAILIASHLSPILPSHLPRIVGRLSKLTTAAAVEGESVLEGRVYFAVPDRHLMLSGSHLRLTRGPRESHARPSIDVLFRSCAASLGARAIGVVLTGALDDGTAGLWAIKDAGGQAIVQSPAEAEYSSMPEHALRHVDVDAACRLSDMPEVLLRAIHEAKRRAEGTSMSDKLQIENRIAAGQDALASGVLKLGEPSAFTCPDCGGALALIRESKIDRFRCHTGHAYSSDALQRAAEETVEQKLWQALRAVDERALLIERRRAAAVAARHEVMEATYRQQAAETQRQGEALHGLLRQLRRTGYKEVTGT
jgi:two-component system, chemotaxis family, protein-glutamate methylesterase/glutaminase